jgi:hypothetical protein
MVLSMCQSHPWRRGALASVVLLCALAAPAADAATGSVPWATVDVCNPADQPNTIGIRASMPGDGQAGERMYMRFSVQYLNPSTHTWLDSAQADSGYVPIGSARERALQSGRSFQFKPAAGQSYVLRGAVSFEWRRGAAVIRSAIIHTHAGHSSAVGADPPGYSAANCTIS